MTQETRRDLRFPLFCALLFAGATAMGLYVWRTNTVVLAENTLTRFAVILAAMFVSEYLAVALPDGPTVSLSYPLSVAAIVLFGPFWGALATAVSALPSFLSRDRPSLLRFSVNTAQTVISAAAAGLLFLWLGGVPLSNPGSPGIARMLLPLGAAATTGILVNACLLAVTFALLQGRRFGDVWTDVIAWTLRSQVVVGFVGLAIAYVVKATEGWGFALFVLPLFVARQTYQQSVKLREAYADTISSLVAALEAKDVYTKGHSVRVAEYTVAIAQSMGFTQEAVHRIEQAALLHDIGKIGVSRRVLAKEARLTDTEYEEIKRHPGIGAHIVADVPYLADLVPIIAHHHERLDGRGYGDGTVGNAIPLEARILAVADSYDAMTSARPYRGAMSHEDAMRELHANSGTQFDPNVVAAFERTEESASDQATSSANAVVLGEA